MANIVGQVATGVEYGLSVFGSVPGLALYSGGLRLALGLSQIGIGTFLFTFTGLNTLSSMSSCKDLCSKGDWKDLKFSGKILLHGFGNSARGLVEFLLARNCFFAPLTLGVLQVGRSYYFFKSAVHIKEHLRGFQPLLISYSSDES